uniref:DNA mismatch repair protein S5 domain-containing protein n=1 Tax=Leersia perrieri TaxID=77586 RepID=A0A0D9VAI6_9ORYZ
MGDPSPSGVAEPPRIRRLEESVVNRIAAGEVIQRPSAAVKELIENSLDAGASSVSVAVKDGGLKLIQVSDDGHGIRFEDLPILCERHTTSKLSAYEDLQTIKSMGFRGEALASMTYVGHVTVTTITEGQLHGYRVAYRDGVMESEPKPCAAVKGTQVMVENLFYNMVARKKTLQNSNDDYPKIVDFISRFAVHHINVTFSCRKHGANRADVHSASTSSRLDAIRSVYGASVVRDLIAIKVSYEDAADANFKMDGYISNANYVAKKITMILFINDRLVDCTALKRAIEFVYSATLPQASKPFIYMSINLPPEHVDVNIHPTKKEVSLLNQDRIIETIRNTIEEKLMNCNTTRIFQTQALNFSGIAQANTQKNKVSEVSMGSVPTPKSCCFMEYFVTWENEKECFRTVAAAIGNFYALHPPILPNPSGKGIHLYKKNRECMADEHAQNDLTSDENDIDQELLAEAETAWAQREWTIQHVLFPSMRLFFKPPKSMATDGTFVQVASLEKLYKIFERC